MKQGILLGFRLGVVAEVVAELPFVDKDTYGVRRFADSGSASCRAVRRCGGEGAYLAGARLHAADMAVNAGAYVGDGR
ncbi:MAG: hypothetical protein R2882_00595 [Gemmatimonadales bacterium]